MKLEEVKPHGVHLSAEIINLPTEIGGVYKGAELQSTKTDIKFYYAKTLIMGSTANEKDQCPELEENIGIVFSQFAGYHVKTEDGFCKVVRGHDVVAILEDMENINEKTIKPTQDRILVKLIEESTIVDGVFNDTKPDSRELDTQMGVVIAKAKGADQSIKVGSIVAFEPFVGNLIFNEPGNKLKTVNSFDIIFSVK